MSTQLFPQSSMAHISSQCSQPLYTNLVGTDTSPVHYSLHDTRGGGTVAITANTVAGPTAGIEMDQTGPALWIGPPVASDVTISGSITFNIWAFESGMNANAAINVRLMKIDNTGLMTEVHKTTRTTELSTTGAAVNWSETPTSFTLNRGDRLAMVIFIDDAGTMGSGFSVSVNLAGPTAGASGDTYVQFTETFSVDDTDPTGTTIYPTDTASAVATASVDREAWTSRGAGVQTDVTDTVAGPTSPIQLTDTAGGTVVDWFTKQLSAFTLAGPVLVNARAAESAFAANAALRCEIAVVDSDGTNPVVWGANAWGSGATPEVSTSETAVRCYISGDDLAVADGQRLRIRFSIDDAGNNSATAVVMGASQTVTLYYAGTSGGASGDTYLIFPVTLTESAPGAAPPFTRRDRLVRDAAHRGPDIGWVP